MAAWLSVRAAMRRDRPLLASDTKGPVGQFEAPMLDEQAAGSSRSNCLCFGGDAVLCFHVI